MDFIETVTLTRQRQYILAAIHHAGRRVRVLGTAAHPAHAWVAQAVRNLLMDLDAGNLAQVRFVIRDRDANYPALIDEILSSAKISTVLTGARMPRMNSITERWVKTLRAELPDRALIWNQTHLRHALHALRAALHPRTALTAPSPRQHPAGTALPSRSRPDRTPRRTPTRPSRRSDPPVPTCRLICADGAFGTHRCRARSVPLRPRSTKSHLCLASCSPAKTPGPGTGDPVRGSLTAPRGQVRGWPDQGAWPRKQGHQAPYART